MHRLGLLLQDKISTTATHSHTRHGMGQAISCGIDMDGLMRESNGGTRI